jgi:toluene monooxygenase system protein B
MEMLPIVCSFQDGCVLTLVPVPVEATMDDVAEACAEHFVGRMLPRYPDLTMRVRKQGDSEFLPRTMRVRDAGWPPLTTVQIAYEAPRPATTH